MPRLVIYIYLCGANRSWIWIWGAGMQLNCFTTWYALLMVKNVCECVFKQKQKAETHTVNRPDYYCDSDCAQAAAEGCAAGEPLQTWKARSSSVHAKCPLHRVHPEAVGSMQLKGKRWFRRHIARLADKTWKKISMTDQLMKEEHMTIEQTRNRQKMTCWNYSHPLHN